jgi:type II secretory pathway pseudopilin PulG
MEVLIAVIIMGFSISIVSYALSNISNTQCVEQLKSQTTALQNAMLDVALGSPPTRQVVSYNFPSCNGQEVAALRFVKYTNPAYCGLCPGQYGSCWIIEPTIYDSNSGSYYTETDASVCVNMPAAIDLQPIDSTYDSGVNGPPACTSDYAGQLFSQTPCPPSASGTCSVSTSGVPTSVYNPSATPSNPNQNQFWTFGKVGGQSTFVIELDKVAEPSQAGVIQVCIKNSTVS